MTGPAPKAVFLSYASQDAEAARRICESLRTGGVEVWFDADGGLEHGDEWDAKIRRQIKECVLFIPVISANTQARHEGYFRIEWDLAAERARGIASGVPFILPVVIDDTREPDALVPDRFRAVQWTRLRAGEVPAEVQQRFLKLWSHRTGVLKHEASVASASSLASDDAGRLQTLPKASRRVPVAAWIALAVVATAAVVFVSHRRTAADSPANSGKPAPLTEARKLVAQARVQLDKPEMARVELNTAESFCQRAAELDAGDAEVWATWSQVNTWFVYYNFDGSLARREAARDYAARAMQLAPRSFEARLAQASYWLRGEGLDVGFVGDEKPPLYQAEAERMLRELHAEKPDEPRTLLMLGFIRVWKNAANPERYDLLERVTKDPAFAAEAWKEIGWVRFFQGDPVGALSAAERSIAIQPTWNNLWLKTLLATVWLGDLDLAKTTLARMPVAALQEDAGLFLTYWVYAWRNEPLVALGQLERQPREWLRMSGYIGPKALLTGKLRRMANHPELARRDFLRARELVEQALATDQNNRNLLSLKAQTLHYLGEDDEARRAYRLAHDLGARGPDLEVLFNSPETFFNGADSTIESLQDRPNPAWYFTAAALRFNPAYAALREHGRFPALLARLDADPRFSPAATSSKRTSAARDLSAAASAKADPRSAQADKSVAVLAFANLSDDRDNEYFSDGIADELLTVLQKIPGLRVAARTSAFSFKGKNATAREVGEQLGMAHVVEGSVQKSGKRVKITARLSRAATNEEIWSESFGPLELTDVFATQSEIAQAIVAKLRGQLTGETATTPAATALQAEIKAQVQAATKGGTKNPEAHQLYLQGRFLATRSGSADVARGIGYYEQALQLDPDFALAWAALARARLWQLSWEPLNPARAQEARTAAARALVLVPDMADAHSVLSQILLRHAYEWRAAREASARALALAPADAAVITDAAATEQALGSLEKSIELARRAVALDPVSVDTRFYLAMSYLFLGRLAEAEGETRRMIELSPNGIFSHGLLSCIHLMQGRPTEALAAALKEPEKMYRLQNLAAAHFALGQRRESDAALRTMITDFKEVGPYPIAWAYTMRGDRDKAFEWLERSYELRDPGISWVRGDTLLKPLHSDPRWPAFLKKIGLTDEQLQ